MEQTRDMHVTHPTISAGKSPPIKDFTFGLYAAELPLHVSPIQALLLCLPL